MGKKQMRRFDSNNENFGLKKHKSKALSLDKIRRGSSSRKRNSVEVLDRISEVPDEILVSILSKLSIKEAARTSILSRRWEKLWICYQGNLEFDATITLRNDAISNRPQILSNSTWQQTTSNWPHVTFDHLKSMNQVLRPLLCSSRLNSPVNSLILRCQYFKTQILEFDTILQFLMAKRTIRILELDMNTMDCFNDFFAFPDEFYDWIKQPRGLHTISAFTSLSFNNVSLSEDTVDYFVFNCPLLEQLCVRKSDLLLHLRIIGDASLKLKYLKVQGYGMKSLVVSAPNLLSLDYQGGFLMKLDVSNVPKLVEVRIGDHSIAYLSRSLSTCLAQIHTLNLSFSMFNPLILLAPNNVVFSNLKHLVLRARIYKQEESLTLLRFTSSLVEASPMLEKFTLDPNYSKGYDELGLPEMTTPTPTRNKYSQSQRLKVVELIGFKGVAPEVELLTYFLQNFGSIEQIVIDTTCTRKLIFETDNVRRHLSQVRKERAMQLMKHIPQGVVFILI